MPNPERVLLPFGHFSKVLSWFRGIQVKLPCPYQDALARAHLSYHPPQRLADESSPVNRLAGRLRSVTVVPVEPMKGEGMVKN
jgi:hypothetical protein